MKKAPVIILLIIALSFQCAGISYALAVRAAGNGELSDDEKIAAIEEWVRQFPELQKILDDNLIIIISEHNLIQQGRYGSYPVIGWTKFLLVEDESDEALFDPKGKRVIGIGDITIKLDTNYDMQELRELIVHELLEIESMVSIFRDSAVCYEHDFKELLKTASYTEWKASSREILSARKYGYDINRPNWAATAFNVVSFIRYLLDKDEQSVNSFRKRLRELLGDSKLGREVEGIAGKMNTRRAWYERRIIECLGMPTEEFQRRVEREGSGRAGFAILSKEQRQSLIDFAEEVLGIKKKPVRQEEHVASLDVSLIRRAVKEITPSVPNVENLTDDDLSAIYKAVTTLSENEAKGKIAAILVARKITTRGKVRMQAKKIYDALENYSPEEPQEAGPGA